MRHRRVFFRNGDGEAPRKTQRGRKVHPLAGGISQSESRREFAGGYLLSARLRALVKNWSFAIATPGSRPNGLNLSPVILSEGVEGWAEAKNLNRTNPAF